MNRLRFTKVRDVQSPTRANSGDAGLDFYIPKDLKPMELRECNPVDDSLKKGIQYMLNTDGTIKGIRLQPHRRILIPSGIRVLLEPKNSMLMAANKSGISTQKGLVYSAEIVDSPYVGEIHIGLINTSCVPVEIPMGKAIQFIHVPIYQTEPEEIPLDEYNKEAEDWGTRGEQGFGSSDLK